MGSRSKAQSTNTQETTNVSSQKDARAVGDNGALIATDGSSVQLIQEFPEEASEFFSALAGDVFDLSRQSITAATNAAQSQAQNANSALLALSAQRDKETQSTLQDIFPIVAVASISLVLASWLRSE